MNATENGETLDARLLALADRLIGQGDYAGAKLVHEAVRRLRTLNPRET